MKICSVDQMKKIDRMAVEDYGIKQEILMENAGEAAFQAIRKKYQVKGKRFLLFCGPGNNGGDGLVLARKLLSGGGKVCIVFMEEEEKFSGAPRENLEIVDKLPVESVGYSEENCKGRLKATDFIVDAIFGTGLTRKVEGKYEDAIGLVNDSEKKVISLDIPSGIEGDSGQEMGVSVHSDLTVTFGLPKLGNVLYPGFSRCGKLYLSRISLPPALTEPDFVKVRTNEPVELPRREPDTHKGSFGRALFIGGAGNYFWAPYASARSFMKAGGGYAYLACPKSIAPSIGQKDCQAVIWPLPESEEGKVGGQAKDELFLEYKEDLRKVETVVLGPGISRNAESQKLVRELVNRLEKPLLLDGDGLTAMVDYKEMLSARKQPTILTPHLGELSQMTGKSIESIKEDKVGVLKETSSKLGSILVIKGAHSLIGYPDGRVYVNPTGNSGMATAGSGDVLTGTIAAMSGQGLKLDQAVRIGVYVHGMAGDLAAEEIGEDGMTAQEVLDYLPEAVRKYRMDYEDLSKSFYGKLSIL